MEVRKATLLDVSPILALLAEMHTEPEQELDKVHWPKVSHLIVQCISNGCVLVAINENNLVIGYIGGDKKTEWYSDIPKLADYWFYVLKDHRKTPAGFKLMKEFKKLAQEANLGLTVGHVLGYDIDRMDKFYTKLGFTRTGTLFSLEGAI